MFRISTSFRVEKVSFDLPAFCAKHRSAVQQYGLPIIPTTPCHAWDHCDLRESRRDLNIPMVRVRATVGVRVRGVLPAGASPRKLGGNHRA